MGSFFMQAARVAHTYAQRTEEYRTHPKPRSIKSISHGGRPHEHCQILTALRFSLNITTVTAETNTSIAQTKTRSTKKQAREWVDSLGRGCVSRRVLFLGHLQLCSVGVHVDK